MAADLFSGVGSLGLEALSRGAVFVTFVEQDAKIIAVLERNIEKAGFVKQSKVIRANAFKIGAPVNFDQQKLAGSEVEGYDLIFVDPPYSATRQTKAGSLLSGLLVLLGEQLAQEGIVVVRTHRHTFPLDQYAPLNIMERRQWGTMAVTILSKRQ